VARARVDFNCFIQTSNFALLCLNKTRRPLVRQC